MITERKPFTRAMSISQRLKRAKWTGKGDRLKHPKLGVQVEIVGRQDWSIYRNGIRLKSGATWGRLVSALNRMGIKAESIEVIDEARSSRKKNPSKRMMTWGGLIKPSSTPQRCESCDRIFTGSTRLVDCPECLHRVGECCMPTKSGPCRRCVISEKRNEIARKRFADMQAVAAVAADRAAREREPEKEATAPQMLREKAPPGWSGTVKAMKKHMSDKEVFARAWAMYKKGAKAHYKPEKGKEGWWKKKKHRDRGYRSAYQKEEGVDVSEMIQQVVDGADPVTVLRTDSILSEMKSATVETFITILAGALTQQDERESRRALKTRKWVNPYQLSHFMGAVGKMRDELKPYMERDDDEAIEAFIASAKRNWIQRGERGGLTARGAAVSSGTSSANEERFVTAAVTRTVKQARAWITSKKYPKYSISSEVRAAARAAKLEDQNTMEVSGNDDWIVILDVVGRVMGLKQEFVVKARDEKEARSKAEIYVRAHRDKYARVSKVLHSSKYRKSSSTFGSPLVMETDSDLESVTEASISSAAARRLSGGPQCKTCGQGLPKYAGRYPGSCPKCGNSFKGVKTEMSLSPGASRALNGGPVCAGCGGGQPKYPGRYPKNCPHCNEEAIWVTREEYDHLSDLFRDDTIDEKRENKLRIIPILAQRMVRF